MRPVFLIADISHDASPLLRSDVLDHMFPNI